MAIDFNRFYRLLDKTSVSIPSPDNVSLGLEEIAKYMVQIHNNRATLDRTRRKLERHVGETRHRLEILTEELRLDRASRMQDPELQEARNKEERDALLDYYTAKLRRRIANLKGKRARLDHALHAVESQDNQLKGGKETLNAMRAMAVAEMENLD